MKSVQTSDPMIQKLLLAMVGHSLVKVTRSDVEDASTKSVVKELLRAGKTYAELNSVLVQLRSRKHHDRLTECVCQCVDGFLDAYLDKVCQAEQEALQGATLHVLRIKWLVSSYIRALPEVLALTKKCREAGRILRVLADAKYSSSPGTSDVVTAALSAALRVLGDAVSSWVLHGELITGSEAYFFIRDTGAISHFDPNNLRTRHARPKEIQSFSLSRFQVILERVPLESRFSLEWANRIAFIGQVTRYLKQRRVMSPPLPDVRVPSAVEDDLVVPPPPPPPPLPVEEESPVAEQRTIFEPLLLRFAQPTSESSHTQMEETTRINTPSLSHDESFNAFDEIRVNILFEQADSALKRCFLDEFNLILPLLRDTFFLGRGELFRVAMDTQGDFEEACTLASAMDIYDFVQWRPQNNTLSLCDNPIILTAGFDVDVVQGQDEDDNVRLFFSSKTAADSPSNESRVVVFREKIQVDNGFELVLQELVLCPQQQQEVNSKSPSLLNDSLHTVDSLSPASLSSSSVRRQREEGREPERKLMEDLSGYCTIFAHPAFLVNTTAVGLMQQAPFPALVVQIHRNKCVLYLDGIFVQEEPFAHSVDVIRRIVIKQNAEGILVRVIVNDDDDGEDVIQLDYTFEDALVLPKWMDAHGRSYFGMSVSSTTSSFSVSEFAITAVEPADSQGLPRAKLRLRRELDFLGHDLFEDANGAFTALFRIKRSHELLSRAWTTCKQGDATQCKLRFAMAQVCSSLVHYFQMDLIDVGIQELKAEIESCQRRPNPVHYEYLSSFTRLALERITMQCALNNRVIKQALEHILRSCDDFSLAVLKTTTTTTTSVAQDFEYAVLGFIQVLKRSQAPYAVDLVQAIDFSGYWHGLL